MTTEARSVHVRVGKRGLRLGRVFLLGWLVIAVALMVVGRLTDRPASATATSSVSISTSPEPGPSGYTASALMSIEGRGEALLSSREAVEEMLRGRRMCRKLFHQMGMREWTQVKGLDKKGFGAFFEDLRRRTEVTFLDHDAGFSLVRVSFTWEDAGLAAEVCNTLVREFGELIQERHTRETEHRLSALSERADELESQRRTGQARAEMLRVQGVLDSGDLVRRRHQQVADAAWAARCKLMESENLLMALKHIRSAREKDASKAPKLPVTDEMMAEVGLKLAVAEAQRDTLDKMLSDMRDDLQRIAIGERKLLEYRRQEEALWGLETSLRREIEDTRTRDRLPHAPVTVMEEATEGDAARHHTASPSTQSTSAEEPEAPATSRGLRATLAPAFGTAFLLAILLTCVFAAFRKSLLAGVLYLIPFAAIAVFVLDITGYVTLPWLS